MQFCWCFFVNIYLYLQY